MKPTQRLRRFSYAAELLTLLLLPVCSFAQGTPVQKASGFRIAGTVVSKVDGHPLAQARVTLASVKDLQHPQSLVTGEDGRFTFSGLAAGKYSLDGAKRGFVRGGYDQHEAYSTAIVTGAGIDTQHLVLRLDPDAFVFGTVLDENGVPVRRASVQLYTVYRGEGSGRIVGNRSTMTDDLGAYELGPDIPGTYFLSVTAQPWYAIHPSPGQNPFPGMPPVQVDPALDVAYPVTYYGDTSDPGETSPIKLRGGDRVEADVHLSPVPSLHVLVQVPQNAGQPSFPQLIQSGLGDDSVVQTSARMVSQGLWDIAGVPEGNYKLRLIGGQGATSRVQDVDVTSTSQAVNASSGEALGSVKAAVQVIGQKLLPLKLAVGLRTANGKLQSWGYVDAKGVAEMNDVMPGRYQVILWNMGPPYAISQISREQGQPSGLNIEIDSGSSISLSLTAVAGTGMLEGVVQRNGKPLAGAMVVLVPKNINDSFLFRRDQSDLDGTFAVSGIVPGNYTLLAIEDGWDIDWSKPDVIFPYLQHGHEVQIDASTSTSVKMTQPVEVQAKY